MKTLTKSIMPLLFLLATMAFIFGVFSYGAYDPLGEKITRNMKMVQKSSNR